MARGRWLGGSLVVAVVADTLTASTEKTFHAVEVASVLSRLRLVCLALAVVHF